jgi:predicted nuclease with TOPRIM domain
LKIQETIADYKTCPLDQKTKKWLQEEMEKLDDFEARVCQLEENVSKLQAGQDVHEKRITDLENKVKTGMLLNIFVLIFYYCN